MKIVNEKTQNVTEHILNENTRYLEMFNSMKLPYTISQIEYAIKCYVHYEMTINMIWSHTGVKPKDLKQLIPKFGYKLRSKIGRCRHFEGYCVYDSNYNPLADVGMGE